MHFIVGINTRKNDLMYTSESFGEGELKLVISLYFRPVYMFLKAGTKNGSTSTYYITSVIQSDKETFFYRLTIVQSRLNKKRAMSIKVVLSNGIKM